MTGATGQIGGELIRLLADDDTLEVVAAARNPEKAKSLEIAYLRHDKLVEPLCQGWTTITL